MFVLTETELAGARSTKTYSEVVEAVCFTSNLSLAMANFVNYHPLSNCVYITETGFVSCNLSAGITPEQLLAAVTYLCKAKKARQMLLDARIELDNF